VEAPEDASQVFTTKKLVAKASLMRNVRYTYIQQISPRRPMLHWDDDLYGALIDPGKPSPYIVTVTNASDVLVRL
jgi:hypothetical protein